MASAVHRNQLAKLSIFVQAKSHPVDFAAPDIHNEVPNPSFLLSKAFQYGLIGAEYLQSARVLLFNEPVHAVAQDGANAAVEAVVERAQLSPQAVVLGVQTKWAIIIRVERVIHGRRVI